MANIVTPCIQVCIIDETTDHCGGCYRSLSEIADWRNFDHEEKIEIMNDLKNRKEKFDSKDK